MMRRSIRGAGVVVGLVALLTGCSGGQSATQPTEAAETESAAPAPSESDAPLTRADADLVIWADEARADVIQEIGDAFGEEEGLTVAVQQLDFGQIRDNLVTQGPEGKGPDIIIGAHDWLGQLVTNGAVAPLELGDRASEFQPVAVQALTYEGSTYGLPYAVENVALFRNTALAPQAPATFADLEATGKQLVAEGKADLPIALQVGEVGDPYHFHPLATSFGSGVFATNPDGSYDPAQLLIDNPGGLRFATELDRLRQEGVLSPDVTFDIALEKFATGRAPYTITGPWNVEAFQEAGIDFSVEAIPSMGGEPARPFVGVQGFMVSAYAENPLVANEFVLNYLGTADVARQLYEAGARPPALTSVYEEVKSDPIIAGFGEVGANGQPLPSIPAMGAVWTDYGNAQRDILLGRGDPQQLMTQAAERIRGLIAEQG